MPRSSGSRHERQEVVGGPVVRFDRQVIDDVVAVVAGRLGDRHQPEPGHAKVVGRGRIAVVEVVEPVGQAAQVADAIAVRIGEAAHEHLVEDAVAPPWRGVAAGHSMRERRRAPPAALAVAAWLLAGVSIDGDGDGLRVVAPHDATIATAMTRARQREQRRTSNATTSARVWSQPTVSADAPRLGPRRDLLPDLPGSLRPLEPGASKPGPLEPWDSPPTIHGFKGGDLLGIVERLDYLADLGINALYLTPIFASASNHRYHTYDYLAVDPLLGGNEALRELLDAAHDRDMRVVLDGVFNHTGRGFWPFHHVLETGAASPYRGWFHLDDAAARSRAAVARVSAARDAPRARSATRRGGGCRPCPS